MTQEDQTELLNKLLSHTGSISEKTSISRKLDTYHLQKAVPHSEYAKIEWERRLNKKKFYEKPIGLIVIGVITGVLCGLIIYLLLGQK